MRINGKIVLLFTVYISFLFVHGCGSADCALTGFVGCNSGGGDNKNRINGTVLNVIGQNEVSGIKVKAERNGEQVASKTTNAQGEFDFKVRDGAITLTFQTSSFNVARVFTVTKNSEVFLEVTLQPAQVMVNDWQVFQDPVRCDGSKSFIIDEQDLGDFIIEGNGKDCIRAKGKCFVDITVQNISLNDCNEGILTENNANVSVEALAPAALTIDAESNGVHTKNNTSVTIAGGDIFVISTKDNGVFAEDSSQVIVLPAGQCTIEGFNNAILEDPTATVNPDGCTLEGG